MVDIMVFDIPKYLKGIIDSLVKLMNSANIVNITLVTNFLPYLVVFPTITFEQLKIYHFYFPIWLIPCVALVIITAYLRNKFSLNDYV